MKMRWKIFSGSALLSALLLMTTLVLSRTSYHTTNLKLFNFLFIFSLSLLVLSSLLALWLGADPNSVTAEQLKKELQEKKEALDQLRQLKTLLVAANDRLSRRLYENEVMLAIWKEQEKAEDTKMFLSHLLETLLPGVPFDYGCILIRPLAAIGPEMIFARMEKSNTRTFEIPLDEKVASRERTLWISEIDPKVKDYLISRGQESKSGKVLSVETTTGNLDGLSGDQEIAVLNLALRQGDEYLGSIHFLTAREMPRIGSSLENFLMNVRSQLALILQNRALSYATRVDPLTRLYNRGYMNDRLREELLRTTRTGRPFTFLMLDVDYFKEINDKFGHQTGDEVLVALASLLKRSCRASDAICRYGGEEIAIILVDTPLAGAKIFAENLRRSIEEETFHCENLDVKITVSMGLAEFPADAENGEDLIEKSDEALYRAKNAGRNNWKSADN